MPVAGWVTKIGCSWCTDYGHYEGIQEGVDAAKVRDVPRWRASAVYDERERAVLAQALGGRARRDVPIGALTTYRVGGRAALFLEATGPADLALAGRALAGSGLPVLILGRGSNLLVADGGFPGRWFARGPVRGSKSSEKMEPDDPN